MHHFANAGCQPARVAVRSSPALSMRELLETVFELTPGFKLPQSSGSRDYYAEFTV